MFGFGKKEETNNTQEVKHLQHINIYNDKDISDMIDAYEAMTESNKSIKEDLKNTQKRFEEIETKRADFHRELTTLVKQLMNLGKEETDSRKTDKKGDTNAKAKASIKSLIDKDY